MRRGRLLADRVTHADRRAGHDRTRADAADLRNWPGLAGQHRLVQLGAAIDDLAVCRTRVHRAHQDDIAGLELVNDERGAAVTDDQPRWAATQRSGRPGGIARISCQ